MTRFRLTRSGSWAACLLALTSAGAHGSYPSLEPGEEFSTPLHPTVVYDTSNGLPDQWVEAAIVHDGQLYAGTRTGLYRFDGLRWEASGVVDTIRWLGSRDELVWACGTRGLWQRAEDGTFELIDDSPGGLRCGWIVEDSLLAGGTARGSPRWALIVGGDDGIHALDSSGAWLSLLDGLRTETLAAHAQRGLLAGTWGLGVRVIPSDDLLWALSGASSLNEAGIHEILSPAAGVTDTLPGNYIHDIKISPDGSVHLATSWGGLNPRYTAYLNAVHKGLIRAPDYHDFRGAAHTVWSSSGWRVLYLLQDYQRSLEHLHAPRVSHVYAGDCDGDGAVEIWLSTLVNRELAPRALLCPDAASGKEEWRLFSPRVTANVVPLSHRGDAIFLLFEIGPDQGAVYGHEDDSDAHARIIDGRGRLLQDRPFKTPHVILHFPETSSRPRHSAALPVYVHTYSDSLLAPRRAWRFDPENLEWTDLGPREMCNSGPYVDVGPRHLTLRSVTERDSVLCVFDLAAGEIHAQERLEKLLRGPGTVHGWYAKLGRGDRSEWMVTIHSADSVLTWDELGIRKASWGFSQPRYLPLPMGLVGDARPELLRNRPGGGFEIWAHRGDPKGLLVPSAGRESQPSQSPWRGEGDQRIELELLSTLPVPNGRPLAFRRIHQAYGEDRERELRWLSTGVGDAELLKRDAHGHALDGVPRPVTLDPSAHLEWITGPPLELDGRPIGMLAQAQQYPWTVVGFDLQRNRPAVAYQIDVPYRARGANALTQLEPEHGYVGTESGVRAWLPGVARSNERPIWPGWIEGLRPGPDGIWVWGERGVMTLAPGAVLLDESLQDLCVHDGGLLGLSNRRVFEWLGPKSHGEAWRGGTPEEGTILDVTEDRVIYVVQSVSLGGGAFLVYDRQEQTTTDLGQIFMFQGANRAIFGLERLSDGRFLIASDWNLHVLRVETREAFTLLEGLKRFRAITRLEGHWLAATVQGQVYRLRERDEAIDVALVDDPPSGPDAVQEWCWSGSTLWFRTESQVGIWNGSRAGRSFKLAYGLSTTALASQANEGVWLGTNGGLWRATKEALVPASVPGLPTQAIRRIIDVRGNDRIHPEIDRDVYVLLADDRLFAFDVPQREGETVVAALGDTVRVGLRPDGAFLGVSAALVRINAAPIWKLASFDQRPSAVLTAQLPKSVRGPQFMEWLVVDDFGRRAGSPATLRRVVRFRSTWVTASVLVVMGLVGALWAFRRPRRRFWIRALGYGGLAVLVLLVPYFLLYYQVPWGSAFAIIGAYGIAGVMLDRRALVQHVEPRRAAERLREILRAFRHRGGGIGPVGEMRLLLTNAHTMSETTPDFEDEVRDVLQRVLDATKDLATGGRRLAEATQLEPALSRRVFRRLEDLREGVLDALHDQIRLRDLLYRHELRVSMVEAATSFLQGAELLGEILRRMEEVRIREFLEQVARQVRRESAWTIEIEIRVADEVPEEFPIPETDLSEVYDNLVRNAMCALEGSTSRRILLSAERDGTRLVLGFEDSGPGVPAAERERIFETDVSLSGGTGFGLSRCAQYVQSWGGTIRCVEGHGLGGARFEIRI